MDNGQDFSVKDIAPISKRYMNSTGRNKFSNNSSLIQPKFPTENLKSEDPNTVQYKEIWKRKFEWDKMWAFAMVIIRNHQTTKEQDKNIV